MLPLQFFGQNVHFAISLFAALVFFAVFWLYIDAWLSQKEGKVLVRWLGFLLLAISFLINATDIEQSVLGRSLLGSVTESLSLIIRLAGYFCIVLGQLLDPLQKVPHFKGIDKKDFSKDSSAKAVGFGSAANLSHLLAPVGALSIAGLYWRRATTGLERHYKSVAKSFAVLFLYEVLSVTHLWRGSTNPNVSQLVAAFGPLWIIEQIVLLVAAIILGRWVWQYLTRRFMSQLFMIFTTLTMVIFLLTTVGFTFLLVSNVQKNSLDDLQTAASVLNYAIDGKKSETLANAQSIAENPAIGRSVSAQNHDALVAQTSTFLHDKKLSSLIITNANGQVLLRAEDPNRFGDSFSSDALVRRAIAGQSASGAISREGVQSPLIILRSIVPIHNESGIIVGTALTSLTVNNAFVDGVKHATGLDSTVYAGNTRSATTLLAPDGVSRGVGVKESSQAVQSHVLTGGQVYKGSVSVQNRQYLAVYLPLRDVDNHVIGMLFIGQPQTAVLQAAGRSVELTFVFTACLLLLTIVPAYFIAKYLASQLE